MFLNIVFKLRLIIIHPHKNWLLNKIYGPCGQENTHKLHAHNNFGVFFPFWPYYYLQERINLSTLKSVSNALYGLIR